MICFSYHLNHTHNLTRALFIRSFFVSFGSLAYILAGYKILIIHYYSFTLFHHNYLRRGSYGTPSNLMS